mmetsp:Transcript_55307/g.91851  ORF Transcript_55307/g.91851 Transcript_55307/m.91851 type:complete len:398 (+) Transcript_55307:29-1222(+)
MSDENQQYEAIYLEWKEKYNNLYETWRQLQLECDEYKQEVEKLKSQNADLQLKNTALGEQINFQPLLTQQMTSCSSALEDADEERMSDKALITDLKKENERLTQDNGQLQQNLSALRDTEIERRNDADRAKQALQTLQQQYDSLNTKLSEQTQMAEKHRTLAKELENRANSLQAEYEEQMQMSFQAMPSKRIRKTTLRFDDLNSSVSPPQRRTLRGQDAVSIGNLGDLFGRTSAGSAADNGTGKFQFVQYDSNQSLPGLDDGSSAQSTANNHDQAYKFIVDEMTDTDDVHATSTSYSGGDRDDGKNCDEHQISMQMQMEELKQKLVQRNDEIEAMQQSQKIQKTELEKLLRVIEIKNAEIEHLEGLQTEVQQLRRVRYPMNNELDSDKCRVFGWSMF